MTTTLLTTNKYFATTQLEADNLVQRAKECHGQYLKTTNVQKKTRRGEEYFLVTITVEMYKVAELMGDSEE